LIFKYLATTLPRKIILTPDQFSKITKMQKQAYINKSAAVPLVTSTSDVNSQLSLSTVEIDLAKSKNCSTTLQYNQVCNLLLK